MKYLIASFAAIGLCFAVPYQGQIFQLAQPDGSKVPVKVYGDEYLQIVESPQGRTLVRGADAWIQYARLDQGQLQGNGERYMGGETPPAWDMDLHLRPAPQVLDSLRLLGKKRLHPETFLPRPPSMPTYNTGVTGNIYGLTILVDFPDKSSDVADSNVQKLMNQSNYKDYGNYGSVRDYYYDMSKGKLSYTQKFAKYTAAHPKSYYDCAGCTTTGAELVDEALRGIKAAGFNFGQISVVGGTWPVNVLYAGSPDQGWSEGLWPHMGWLDGSFSASGIQAWNYQLTNIGTSPTVGTLVHENGHMLCGFPDLYDYDSHGNPVNGWDVMGSGSWGSGDGKTPVGMNGFFRYAMGWISAPDLTAGLAGQSYSLNADSMSVYRYGGALDGSADEFYYVENRKKTAWDTWLPGAGLIVWHVDYNGDNTLSSTDDLMAQYGPFDAAHPRFAYAVNSQVQWHNGKHSAIDLRTSSPQGNVMSFNLGVASSAALSSSAQSSSALLSSALLSSSSALSSSAISSIGGSSAGALSSALISSSAPSSSSQGLSSSLGVVSRAVQNPAPELLHWSAQGLEVQAVGELEIKVLSPRGELVYQGKLWGSQSVAFAKNLSSGYWMVQLRSGANQWTHVISIL